MVSLGLDASSGGSILAAILVPFLAVINTMNPWIALVRPFTLLPPAAGMASGTLVALGSAQPPALIDPPVPWALAAGALAAALLNGGSNGLNQVYDAPLDAVNKPGRPIPSGQLTPPAVLPVVVALYAAGLALAATLGTACLVLFCLAAFCTWAYSAPPLRTRRNAWMALLTIAIPRGLLLPVAGWSTLRSPWVAEPWLIGAVYGLFVLGAASTKDFTDMPGDEAHGCTTLPILLGPERCVQFMAPFLIVPFAFLSAVAGGSGWLSGNRTVLVALGAFLSLWGLYASLLLLRDPQALARTENHPSWTHMYLMMLSCQVGVGLAYTFTGG